MGEDVHQARQWLLRTALPKLWDLWYARNRPMDSAQDLALSELLDLLAPGDWLLTGYEEITRAAALVAQVSEDPEEHNLATRIAEVAVGVVTNALSPRTLPLGSRRQVSWESGSLSFQSGGYRIFITGTGKDETRVKALVQAVANRTCRWVTTFLGKPLGLSFEGSTWWGADIRKVPRWTSTRRLVELDDNQTAY